MIRKYDAFKKKKRPRNSTDLKEQVCKTEQEERVKTRLAQEGF